MRLRGKYLCWLFVMMVFCAVSFGGCGGSSTGSISGSDDITVPDTPASSDSYTPVPAPDTTVSPDEPAAVPDDISSSFWPDVSGTWKVEAATIDFQDGRIGTLDHQIVPVFEITTSVSAGTIDFSGEGIETNYYGNFVKWYYKLSPTDENNNFVMFPSGPLRIENFDYVGDNTYKAYDDKASLTISFPNSFTMTFDSFEYGYDTNTEIIVTLKRVN